ncbi:hypothetical protein [Nocardia sp. NPDC051981]|uniref:hypothetical protein n=1 Tax=Nocardia sp. NPDC051981 TaxID=3155417 RepID=UPI003419FB43
MGNGSGVSRGDRNRNARLARLRGLVPVSNAIVGIDLAERKQMVVVVEHDSDRRLRAARRAVGRGGPYSASRHPVISPVILGSPDLSSPQPDYTLQGTNPITAMPGLQTRAPTEPLDTKRLTLMTGGLELQQVDRPGFG